MAPGSDPTLSQTQNLALAAASSPSHSSETYLDHAIQRLPWKQFSTVVEQSPAEPRPLMKLGVSGSVRLIGQVCPGLRLPVIEVSTEGPLCRRLCTLLRSTPTAKTLAAPFSASP
ncbi:unnamed protein product [Pleuronectes platessa]|uniref:Uncharacterized protein n=1 Tax=Pleuronectes platessa TaxID=8262 RepID=A0A9N7Y3F1_PLEPL|nr:unnamed protein product [Pleuronectes platessa]